MLTHIASTLDLSSPGAKTLLTPSFVHPGVLKRSLTLKSGKLANLRVVSLRAFLVEQALPFIPGKTFLSGDRKFWFVFNLLNELKPRLHYFGETVEFHGLTSLLVSTIEELRLNGVSPSHISKLPNKAKWTDIALILKEYDALKKSQNMFDYADAVFALRLQKPVWPQTYVLKHNLSSVEGEILSRAGVAEVDPDRTTAEPTFKLSGYRVDTPHQEALQTVRNLMADMLTASAPVRIGVCVPDYDAAFYAIREALQQLGLTDMVHFLRGEPLFATAAGSFWKYFAEWAANDFSIYRFLRILQSPAFDRLWLIEKTGRPKGESISPQLFYRAVNLFRDAGLVLFDDQFLKAFEEFAQHDGISDPEDEKQQIEKAAGDLALAIAKTFNAVHLAPAPVERLRQLAALFTSTFHVRNEEDAVAAARIENAVNELLSNLPSSISLTDALILLMDGLASQHVRSTLPNFDRPVVGTADDLRCFEFDTLYITGLNEKGMPRKFAENPVLLDGEKNELKGLAPASRFLLKEDLLRNDEARFEQLKRTAGNRLILSAPLKDLTSGREYLVSRYLLTEWNRYHGKSFDYRSIARILAGVQEAKNNFVPVAAEEAFHPFERAMAVHFAADDTPRRNGLLPRTFPFAASAAGFRSRRRTATSFDDSWGVIHPDRSQVLPVMSASRLGTYCACAHKYFLKYVLYLDTAEDHDAGSLEWLDPLQYGSLVHDILFAYMLRLRERKGKDFTKVTRVDEALLRKTVDGVVADYRLRAPVKSELHYESQVAQLQRDLGGFFAREASNSDTRRFVELAFNMQSREGREPDLSRDEPCTIPLLDGTTLQVRGSIDRVDQNDAGRPILIDYKTGKAQVPPAKKPFHGGRLLQGGIYSEVAQQIHRSLKDPLFRFYFVTEAGGYKTYEIEYATQRPHFLKLLTAIISQLRMGNFVPIGVERSACEWCDYKAVCYDSKKWLIGRLKEDDAHYEAHQSIKKEEV